IKIMANSLHSLLKSFITMNDAQTVNLEKEDRLGKIYYSMKESCIGMGSITLSEYESIQSAWEQYWIVKNSNELYAQKIEEEKEQLIERMLSIQDIPFNYEYDTESPTCKRVYTVTLSFNEKTGKYIIQLDNETDKVLTVG